MSNKLLLAGLVVVLALGVIFPRGNTVVERVIDRVGGAASGTVHNNREEFKAGLSFGGRMATSSTATAYTPTAADLATCPSYIDWTPNVNTTISLSATSTSSCIPDVGDVWITHLRNASSTAAASITLAAADAGVDLQFVEATGGDLVLIGLDFGQLTFIREDTHKTSVLFAEFTEAD